MNLQLLEQQTDRVSKLSNNLYDRDFCLWAETMAELLGQRQFWELDLDNLIEEVKDMSRRDKDALRSNLRVLLMHLLKYQYQPEKRSKSWLSTIIEHRQRLNEKIKDSPSLKPYFDQILDDAYETAREIAANETDLSLDVFPVKVPFSPEEILNKEFLPDTNLVENINQDFVVE